MGNKYSTLSRYLNPNFDTRYPYLAKFSGSYVRTRRGRKEIVRKGKRKRKRLNKAAKAILLGMGASVLAMTPMLIAMGSKKTYKFKGKSAGIPHRKKPKAPRRNHQRPPQQVEVSPNGYTMRTIQQV